MRGTEVSEFIDLAYTWQERATEAEAEVERLKKVYATTNDSWKKLQAENIKLWAVVEAARGAIRYIDADVEDECCCVGCQTCRQLRAALTELDKEGER